MARNHPNGTTPTHPPCCERSRMMRTNETEVLQAAAECDFDVAIVGYGPVGQALAALLGQAGHRVGVFERLPQIYGLPRALHIDHEIVRLLQPHGLAEQANERLARVEQIKRFRIIEDEWRAGGDEPTPTMKLKRGPIAAKYAAVIEELYAG